MTANMAICRTSIHTSPAANTAQHIPKFRGQHLRTPVIDNNQMKLFRTINVPRFARSCQPCCIPSNVHQRHCAPAWRSIHLPRQTWGNTLHSHHCNMRFRQRGTHSRITFIGHRAYRTCLCHREITAGNTYFSTEEIFADFCRMNKVIASGVSGPS